MNIIIEAARFAAMAHRHQFRKYSNASQPYIVHPMRVAGRVTLVYKATEEMVAAAWLHDVVEDTVFTAEDISKRFGKDVTLLVKQLTNPSKEADKSLTRHEKKKLDREHVDKACKKAKIIKLADRIDNMQGLKTDPLVPEDFLKVYLLETEALLGVLFGANHTLEQELKELL